MILTVKAQLPIVSSESDPLMLVYTRDRVVHRMLPITPQWREWFGDKLKIYLRADVQPGGAVTPIELIEDQPW